MEIKILLGKAIEGVEQEGDPAVTHWMINRGPYEAKVTEWRFRGPDSPPEKKYSFHLKIGSKYILHSQPNVLSSEEAIDQIQQALRDYLREKREVEQLFGARGIMTKERPEAEFEVIPKPRPTHLPESGIGMKDDIILDVEVGQYAIIEFSDGLHACKVLAIYQSYVTGPFCERTFVSSSQALHLDWGGISLSSAVKRILRTEMEARLFMAEQQIVKLERELQTERAANALLKESQRMA